MKNEECESQGLALRDNESLLEEGDSTSPEPEIASVQINKPVVKLVYAWLEIIENRDKDLSEIPFTEEERYLLSKFRAIYHNRKVSRIVFALNHFSVQANDQITAEEVRFIKSVTDRMTECALMKAGGKKALKTTL